uniref:Transmembrane protein 170A n=1 Tax=Timema douglasi TaxID=61478 RepID=A0A7R8VIN0_TIMDO|nr:unnamed protein product [Timema douglasi]
MRRSRLQEENQRQFLTKKRLLYSATSEAYQVCYETGLMGRQRAAKSYIAKLCDIVVVLRLFYAVVIRLTITSNDKMNIIKIMRKQLLVLNKLWENTWTPEDQENDDDDIPKRLYEETCFETSHAVKDLEGTSLALKIPLAKSHMVKSGKCVATNLCSQSVHLGMLHKFRPALPKTFGKWPHLVGMCTISALQELVVHKGVPIIHGTHLCCLNEDGPMIRHMDTAHHFQFLWHGAALCRVFEDFHFPEMWYQIFLWALFSSLFVHAIAAAIAFATLRKHKFGKFFSGFILVMGVLAPLTSGVVSSAAVAFVYRASNFKMTPLYAILWGVGQTIVAACIGFTRILATL